MTAESKQPSAQQVEQQDTPGSAFHYSYHSLPASQLIQINALFALHKQLMNIGRVTADKNVAYTKLHWWFEEVDRLKAQQARHPITKALTDTIVANKYHELFEQLLSAAKMELDYDSYPNYLTLCQYLDGGMGSLMQAVSYVCGDVNEGFGKHLGRAIGQVQKLQTIASDLQAGHLYIPISDLNKHQLDAETFRANSQPEKSQQLINFTIDRCETEFAHAFKTLDQQAASQQVSSLSYARIHQSIMKKISSGDLQCMQSQPTLSPLRKMFTAMLTNPDKIVRQYKHEQ